MGDDVAQLRNSARNSADEALSDWAEQVSSRGKAKRARRTSATSAVEVAKAIDDTGHSVAYLIRDVHRLFKIALRPFLSTRGITTANWYYIRALWEGEGISQQELAERVGVSSQTAVPAVDNMEKNGLIKRGPDPNDRRKFKIWLTPKARALKQELLPQAYELLLRATEGVEKKDLDCFFRVTHRMRKNLLREAAGKLDILD